MRHTLEYNIFRRLYDKLHSILPHHVRKDVETGFSIIDEHGSDDFGGHEDVILMFGRKLWPYRKAFDAVYQQSESELGPAFLKQQLPRSLHQICDVKDAYRELKRGQDVSAFSPDERAALAVAFVEADKYLANHTVQSIHSTREDFFNMQLKRYSEQYEEIERLLQELRELAQEQVHERVADDILSQVRGFEHGMCFFGPEQSVHALRSAFEHYKGRIKEINVLMV